ncbi:hypothetical protein [Wolbachia endosymbiont of Ctenocephalides felis wCfeJ]|nr:hypothetical protein [Wolbachia endosymbiont of Ctenocephalides felis wCfeJ]WCR57609.1 MAG: hypothetical protein PG980_000081 [Wolbachia endosymbiont of Ctenocephalides felis wCfeJ]
MTTTIKQNHSENFSKNKGKVNSKGMVAPPVPPRAPETKLSSQNMR